MAGMKRFVTYIYAYEEKQKAGNTGFAKIEIRGEECRLEIHLRGAYLSHMTCKVYLFRVKEGRMEGVLLGQMSANNGAGDFVAKLRTGKIGNTPFTFAEMEGIFLCGEDNRIFMSRWKEGTPLEVSMSHFKEWEPQVESPKTPEKAAQNITSGIKMKAEHEVKPNSVQMDNRRRQLQEARMREEQRREEQRREARKREEQRREAQKREEQRREAQKREELIRENQRREEEKREEQIKEENQRREAQSGEIQEKKETETEEQIRRAQIKEAEENVAATEIPMRNIFPRYNWMEIWKNLIENHPAATPFENQEIVCVKIELKDLKELPRRYWYLGNNSFLLHGFFNYHYIVIGKIEEDRWFIGVPGIYQNQERVMAAIFGFPEFLPEQVENQFGYWYRFIEE